MFMQIQDPRSLLKNCKDLSVVVNNNVVRSSSAIGNTNSSNDGVVYFPPEDEKSRVIYKSFKPLDTL